MSEPKMYRELASWFHLITAPEEYEEEAELYRRTLLEAAGGPVRSVLELGSGGGNNASHLRAHFDMTLVDLSEEMLALSRGLNPGCEHVVGDMRTVRLDREFDAVFVHDAIDYMTTEADLRSVMETAWIHLRPGGPALFVPDYVLETFHPGTDHGGHDGEGRALRYLEWTWDPDPEDDTYVADFAYLLRETDGTVSLEWDRHLCGLFARDRWFGLLEEAGFSARHLGRGQDGGELFVGVKPSA